MECQPVATIPEVLAKVDLFQAFRTLFLLVYKVANSVYYVQGGRGWIPPPKVFLSFLVEDKTSALDVFSSCSFIPRAHFESSSVMVRFNGYEI